MSLYELHEIVFELLTIINNAKLSDRLLALLYGFASLSCDFNSRSHNRQRTSSSSSGLLDRKDVLLMYLHRTI